MAQTVAFSRGCETIGKQCKVMSLGKAQRTKAWGVEGEKLRGFVSYFKIPHKRTALEIDSAHIEERLRCRL